MGSENAWVRFEVAGTRLALAVTSVGQVVGLDHLRPVGTVGWAGLLPVGGGALPVAVGSVLLSDPSPMRHAARGIAIRGRVPLAFTVDRVLGLVRGEICALANRAALSPLAEAVLPSADGDAIVLDADRIWRRLSAGLMPQADGPGYRLLPLAGGSRAEARSSAGGDGQPVIPAPRVGGERTRAPVPCGEPGFSGRVLVFRSGLPVDLGVPLERVLEVGPDRAARSLPNGPPHLAGLVDWRGRLVPLIDLAQRLGTAVKEPRQTLFLALVGRVAPAVAVLVGEIAGPAMVPGVKTTVPDFGLPATWVRGVARIGRRPLVVLDPDSMVRA